MARLPAVNGDDGEWGEILNEYLEVSHDAAGYLKAGVVGSNQLANGAVTANAVADNALPIAKVQNLSATLDAKYTKPAEGVPRTDLSQDVRDSLARADTALQTPTGPSVLGAVSYSGFPLRLPGEKAISTYQEVAVARAYSSDPSGSKPVVLAESWDKPGVLKHVWVACDNSETVDRFLEQGSVIRIYTDDDTTPAVSMSLGDFFCLANRSDIFSTPRVGRTNRGSGGSAYRYLYMPFQKYLRVEIENTSSTDVAFYGTASFSTVNAFEDLGDQQLAYTIRGQRQSNHPVLQPMTICDIEGSGQVESLMLSFSGADDDDAGILEGNVLIYVDDEVFPSWASSGMEDAFNGGWYAIPIGGYPAGRAGNSDRPGINETMYRFFLDDPIFYSSRIKVVAWAGQPRQGTIQSSTVNFAGYVGLWSTTAGTPQYTAVDTVAAPLLNESMDQAAGGLASSDWIQDPSRTQFIATGSTFAVPYESGGSGHDVRAGRLNVVPPGDYWLETRVRITDATQDDQQAALVMLGASPDPYFGSAVHVMIRRAHANQWCIELRDDFGTPFITYVGSSADLTGVWVNLALKKQGTKVTGYYTFNSAAGVWTAIGTWTPTKTGTGFGISTWAAGAEFDHLIMRPLRTVTN